MTSNEAQSDFPGLIGQHLYPSVSTEEENCNGNDECLFFIYLANVIFCHLFQAPGGDRTQAERKSQRALKRFFVRGSGCACGCRPSSRSTLAPSGEHTAGHSQHLHPTPPDVEETITEKKNTLRYSSSHQSSVREAILTSSEGKHHSCFELHHLD